MAYEGVQIWLLASLSRIRSFGGEYWIDRKVMVTYEMCCWGIDT